MPRIPTHRAPSLLRTVNPLGWVVLGLGVGAAVVGLVAGWSELVVVALACGALLLLAVPFVFGRTTVDVRLDVEPDRVVAGMPVAAGVTVVNVASRRMLPTWLELPVGEVLHRYPVGSLASGDAHEETLTIRTERRGVIAVGPVTTRRGDPLGVLSRDVTWTKVREVLVRPPMVPLDALGAGLLRDLEGVQTDAVSQSDLAFHALREYVPGDDLRHVHWRSSAKAMAAAGENQLLVRQYLDTRRSHLTVVVDDDPAAYPDLDDDGRSADFETAMSVAASLAVRAVLDGFEVSYVCGPQAATGSDGHRALDAVCRSEPTGTGLVPGAHRAASVAADTSLLFLVSGAATTFETLLRAGIAFAPEVRRYGVLVDARRTSGVAETSGLPVLRLAARDDLPGLLRWGAS